MLDSTGHPCIVIGAGPAGLATAAQLQGQGVPALIVDRATAVAESWRTRYDGFRLNTSRHFSHLPGRRIPRDYGTWPSREAMVAYFEDYAACHNLRVELDVEVVRIERAGHGWELSIQDGPALQASRVVVATGNYRTPVIPPWPGRELFTGQLVHSSDYRRPDAFVGRDVLVVGTGNSAADIATRLATGGARHVWLGMRTPPHLVLRTLGPIPADVLGIALSRVPAPIVDRLFRVVRRRVIGDLAAYGLPEPRDGIFTSIRDRHRIPTIADDLLRAVRSGAIEVVGAVSALTSDGAQLADGSEVRVDAIVAATGFARGLEPLVGHLGVLNPDGAPIRQGAGAAPGCPGLYFIGFVEPNSGPLREFRIVSQRLARHIAADTQMAMKPRVRITSSAVSGLAGQDSSRFQK